MAFWTYLLHCRGGIFYVGHTDDLERRLAQHQHGSVPGFANDHRPVTLVWSETFPTRADALAMERRLKGWSRAKKLALIRGDWDAISRLARSKDQDMLSRSEGQDRPSTSSGRTEG
jgi:putative endonuclease